MPAGRLKCHSNVISVINTVNPLKPEFEATGFQMLRNKSESDKIQLRHRRMSRRTDEKPQNPTTIQD